MQMHEKFSFATKLLVEANLSRQSEIRPEFPGISAKGWSKEFCTIRLSAGRGSGMTYTAIDIALTMFKRPLILSANQNQRGILRQLVLSQANDKNMSSAALIVKCVEDDLRGLSPDSIIVDCVSLFSNAKLERMYEMFGPIALLQDFCFVLLG